MALTSQALKEVICFQYTAQCLWNRRYLNICWKKVLNVSTGFRNSAAAAKPLQSCPTLCDPIDGSPLGSSVTRILQARILEWVAISFSNAWKWKAKVKSLSHARLLATPWTAAYQAPPSMGFARQEYWSGMPLPSPKREYALCKFKFSINTVLASFMQQVKHLGHRIFPKCYWS